MSAFIIVDITPLNADKLKEYGAAAASTIAQYQGEFVVKGPIESLTGGEHHQNKVVIQFPDRQAAVNWYHSAEYQAIIPLRNQGMDSVFHLVG